MKKVFFKALVIVLLFIASTFVIFPRNARATVPNWNVDLSGPIPMFIPAISMPVKDPGWFLNKEVSISGISLGSILTKLIPSWDAVAKVLAREALQVIKDHTISWIRSGFDGEPLFLQDPEKFFTEMGDQASGVFLEDLGMQVAGDPNFFCSDFLPKFQLDIGGYGRGQYFQRAQCTMSEVVDNVEDYYNDFSNGNWNAFVSMNQRNNNQIGFYMMALEEHDRRRAEAEDLFQLTSQYGGGYLPTMRCLEGNAAGCRKFQIRTPSKAIGDRIGQMVGIDFGDVIAADEVSEVVSAIAQELIRYGLKETMNSFL